MISIQEKDIQSASAASDMYQLLSIFFRLPTAQLAVSLSDGTLAEDLWAIMHELEFSAQDIEKIKKDFIFIQESGSDEELLLTAMRREYTRLFTHPVKPAVHIYETLFHHRPTEDDRSNPPLFISPAALDAERCYKKAGLILSSEVREPADHLATEMEFMMYLYLQKAKALQEDNSHEIICREKEIQEFTEIHLQKWGEGFFDLCISSSRNDAYRAFANIGKMYMKKMLPCK